MATTPPADPLVSVVIAVYNGEPTIGAAIDSVLAQTWSNLECIVIDDGSSDGTRAAVEQRAGDTRLRYAHQPNRGVARARNAGIERATGELIAFLDADDVWLPDKLSKQVALLKRRPDVALVFAGYAIADDDLEPRSVVVTRGEAVHVLGWLLLEGDGLGLSFTGVVRSDAVADVGGFDETLSTSADLDFACRVADRHGIAAVPEVLALYRTHPGQMHFDMELFEHDILRIYAQRFAGNPEMLRARRRGTANLYTRICAAAIVARDRRAALRAGRLALRHDPTRVIVLPVRIAIGRARRRINLMTLQRRGRRRDGAAPLSRS
jgi:glycosyltransferase involved in cell wall biosynthesis